MKKLILVILMIGFFGSSFGQDSKQKEVITFLNGSKKILPEKSPKEYEIIEKIATNIVVKSSGLEVPLDSFRKKDTYIVLSVNSKNKFIVYYYSLNKKLNKKFIFTNSFEKKLSNIYFI